MTALPKSGVSLGAVIETDRVADILAEGLLPFVAETLGHSDGGHTTRLGHHYLDRGGAFLFG